MARVPRDEPMQSAGVTLAPSKVYGKPGSLPGTSLQPANPAVALALMVREL